MSQTHTAFFYGTLMASPVLYRVIWGSPSGSNVSEAQRALLKIRPAILHKFQRRKVRGADYPAILPANSTTTVRGTLVSGLSDGDMWRLDIFEGGEYERRKVKVRVLEQNARDNKGEGGVGELSQPEAENIEGAELEAESYIWIAGQHRLENEEWDFSEFTREKMSRWVGREAAETDEGFQGRHSINGARAHLNTLLRAKADQTLQTSTMQSQHSTILPVDEA
jgi:hypothetical protein